MSVIDINDWLRVIINESSSANSESSNPSKGLSLKSSCSRGVGGVGKRDVVDNWDEGVDGLIAPTIVVFCCSFGQRLGECDAFLPFFCKQPCGHGRRVMLAVTGGDRRQFAVVEDNLRS